MRATTRKQSILNLAFMGAFSAAVIVASGSRASGEETANADREKFHAAHEACMKETGVSKPTKGQPPSEADRKKMDTCLQAKGFTKPPRPPGPHGGRPPGPPPQPPGDEAAPPAPPATDDGASS